jgi:hypothetical protein
MSGDVLQQQQPCCPKFAPDRWDDKVHVWKDKRFIKDSIPVFWHIPWPPMIGRLMRRMWVKVVLADASPELEGFLALANDPTPWRTEFYMTTTKEVPDAENVILSGTFVSKVFDGPYQAAPKWIKEMDQLLASQNRKAKKYYFHYTSCPKCAKIYGHNYVVVFAEIDS